jgi:hypothetical protein
VAPHTIRDVDPLAITARPAKRRRTHCSELQALVSYAVTSNASIHIRIRIGIRKTYIARRQYRYRSNYLQKIFLMQFSFQSRSEM